MTGGGKFESPSVAWNQYNMPELQEKIVFGIEVPKAAGSFAAIIKQLQTVDGYIESINRKLSGLNVQPQFARTFNSLEKEIKAFQSKQGGLGVESLAKTLGFDPAQVKRFFTQAKTELKGYKAAAQEFTSAPNAASAFNKFAQQQRLVAREAAAGLKNLFTPTQGQLTSAGAAVKIEGVIPLTIPGAQIQASVAGTVNLVIPGGQISGQGTMGNGQRDPATGQFLTGAGGGGRGRGKRGKGTLKLPGGGDNVIERVRVETADYLRETVTEATALGETVSKTYDAVDNAIRKTVTRTSERQRLLGEFKEKRARLEAGFKTAKAGILPGDYGGLARLQEAQSGGLLQLIPADLAAQMTAKGYGGVVSKVSGQAGILSAQSAANFGKAEQAAQAAARERFLKASSDYQAQRDRQRAADQEQAERNIKARQIRRQRIEERTPPVIPPPMPEGRPAKAGSFQKAFQSFMPAGFALNFVKVAGWAAAVTVLYKSVELANYGLQRMLEIGSQTARLSQIFRGVGGSAQELTGDITELASANGRSTEEAMEAGIAWARLGLTRAEVNEAVRVSLVAANLADVHAGDATKYLSSIMITYGFSVRELSGVLGMLNNTSNKYNVTNEDLFQGLSRTASVAKQAGFSFAELQGIIGATASRTGMSGVTVANAFKSVIGALSRPENGAYLHDIGIETSGKGAGEMKAVSEVLRELYVRYQGMNDQERQTLRTRIAGTRQASQFVAVMDSYVQGQKAAADSQLNLNSAQNENVKIMATQKAQWMAVRSEFDKFVVTAANAKTPFGTINETMTEIARGATTGLRVGARLIGMAGAGEANPRQTGLELAGRGGIAGTLRRLAFAQAHPVTSANLFWEGLEDITSGTRHLRDERDLGRVTDPELKMRNAAAGHQRLARLYRTVGEGLMGSRPEEAIGQVKGLLEGRAGARLEALVRGGQMGPARSLLRGAAEGREEQSKNEAKATLQLKGQAIALLDQQIEAAKHQEDAEQRINELTAKRNELTEQRLQLMDLESEQDEQAFGRLQGVIDLLERQKTITETIGELWQQMPTANFSDRLNNRLGALTGERDQIDTALQALRETPGYVPRASEQLEAQRREIQGRIDALDSAQNRGLTAQQDRNSLVFRRTSEEAASYGVGTTDAAKLINRQREIERQLGPLEKKTPGDLTDNEAARGLQLEIELHQTKEQIQQRIVMLKGQERQIQLESIRDFQKSLLFAGPGELLKKMAAFKLNASGLNTGGFFALSPELRHDIDTLHGGEAGRTNRLERRQLARFGQTIEQQQAAEAAGSRDTRHFAGVLGTRTPAAPGLDAEMRGRVESARQLTAFHQTLLAATLVTQRFSIAIGEVLSRLGTGGAGATPPAGRLNIDTGHALGAPSPFGAHTTTLVTDFSK